MKTSFLLPALTLSSFLFALEDFELIHVKDAWRQGITGKNIAIGIIDTGFDIQHPLLRNQFIQVLPSLDLRHGTQVASVAVGGKMGNQPFGIAFNAKFFGLPYEGYEAYNYFQNKEIKVINNSWGYPIYPVLRLQEIDGALIQNQNLDQPRLIMQTIQRLPYVKDLARLSREKKVLSVFSTGNSAMSSGSITATLPRYDESLRAWLAIGAIDSKYISKDKNRQLVLQSKALAEFSNGFKGISLFALSAPGVNVSVAKVGGGIGKSDGTSFSSPMVSGASALILEKFPFLNGAQIADILLSTANKDYIPPQVVLKKTYLKKIPKYTIIYIDHSGPLPSQNQARNDLLNAGHSLEEINQAFLNPLEGFANLIQNLTKEEVFGQGILDIKSALEGIALLDANRLNQEDIYTLPTGDQALLYSFDTQGHSATFSHNIDQRKWDSKYHHPNALNALPQENRDFNVGLVKKGQGTLELVGENHYQGATLIQEGVIALNKKSDLSGGTLYGAVYIEKHGKLQGNGIVKKDIQNNGILSPGNHDFDTLTIEGSYTQNPQATLQIYFGTTDKDNIHSSDHAKLKAGHYTINGGALLYTPLKNRFYAEGDLIPIALETNLKTQIKHFSNISVQSNLSQSIHFLLQDPSHILIQRKHNAYALEDIKSNLDQILRNIVQNPNLSQTYKDYFAHIDTAPYSQYAESLRGLEGDLYLKNTKEVLNTQARFTLSDIALLLKSPKEAQWCLTPAFSYVKDSQYSSYIASLLAQGKTKLSPQVMLSAFGHFSNLYTQDQPSTINSQMISGGVSVSYDLDHIELFGGIATGFIYNTFQHRILFIDNKKGHYHNLLFSAHLGLGKSYEFDTFFISPMIFLQDSYLYQKDWKEGQQNNETFNKSYLQAHFNLLDAVMGLELGYQDYSLKFGIFGFYTRHLTGTNLKNQAYFQDFPHLPLQQRYSFQPDLYKVGTSFSYTFHRFITSLKINADLTKNFWSASGELGLGMKL